MYEIRSNVVKTAAVEVVVYMPFDSDMDRDSSLYISCKLDDSEIFHEVLDIIMAMEWMTKNVLNNESYYDKNELDNVRDESLFLYISKIHGFEFVQNRFASINAS